MPGEREPKSTEEFLTYLALAMEANAEQLRAGANLMDEVLLHAEPSMRSPGHVEEVRAWQEGARRAAAADVQAAEVARRGARELRGAQ